MRRTKFIEIKYCAKCGKAFPKHRKHSHKQWAETKYCSPHCRVWNKGLTKHDDPRIMAVSEAMIGVHLGRIPWNKGLTKEDDERIMNISKLVSESNKGRKADANMLRGLEHGRTWFKGRTKETCEIVARRAAILAEKYKGIPNPEHGIWLSKFYKENPDKHPNAILAKKTRGQGYTYIEKVVSELLDELGISYEFNMRVDRKWVDFGIVDKFAVIECDGEFWHQDQVKEEKRDAYIQVRGWKILHLTGSDIVARTAWCKERISEFLSIETAKTG